MRLSACVLLLSGLTSMSASAATIMLGGGTTTVEFVPAVVQTLTDAGLTLSPLGTASLSGTTAMFPITGGMIDTDTEMAEIYHNGSGLRFDDGMMMLDLMNFVISATITPGSESGLLTGDVMGAVDLSDVPLFDIGPGLQLTLRAEAAGALSNAEELRIFHNPAPAFGGPNNGPPAITALLGIDNIQAVPEPSSILLLSSGIGVLLWLRNRQS